MKVLHLPETEYMAETEHRIPDDGYDHKVLKCPCQPEFERDGNVIIVTHMTVVERKA